ncbi:DUF1801 domain-containing protein [Hymenobacter weizhouensis]|uniref:DUF1801 domain-containing protein n=1 Tax=Hymenobacter sp. YIM 151500-1 TaxID=2987689 RepID=UPI0022273638|nr:DUF1801 domain-containing protein [Hymenobacter sp. YIM 151500-1]UYZ63474.1 DUF1801 domain-containing protein [Hymenobacter sp. YIM 151500-1]
MPTPAYSYKDFVAALPAERQATVQGVWDTVRAAMPAGYVEQASATMLQFVADGEMAVALASKKNYLSLYLMTLYHFPERAKLLQAAAPKLKLGKSCINFNRVEELPLEAIAELLRGISAPQYLERIASNKRNPHQQPADGTS